MNHQKLVLRSPLSKMNFVFIIIFCTILFPQETNTSLRDTTKKEETTFPAVDLEREKPAKLPEGEPFFNYKANLQNLQTQMDSLKRVIRVMERSKAIPAINEELLNLIRIPELQHRIELANGTVVIGQIIEESDEVVLIQTSIGKLSIDKENVVKIDEDAPPTPKVELIGDPIVDVYPDHEEIRGVLKNNGQSRADFVRIIANLWNAETKLTASDSAFAQGSLETYPSGVITDTAIEQGATAGFTIIVPLTDNSQRVEYRTYDIRWMVVGKR